MWIFPKPLREANAADADVQNAWLSRIRHYIQHLERKSPGLIKMGQARGRGPDDGSETGKGACVHARAHLLMPGFQQ